jgi:hypothetical protein
LRVRRNLPIFYLNERLVAEPMLQELGEQAKIAPTNRRNVCHAHPTADRPIKHPLRQFQRGAKLMPL